jgi:hypothetical protein
MAERVGRNILPVPHASSHVPTREFSGRFSDSGTVVSTVMDSGLDRNLNPECVAMRNKSHGSTRNIERCLDTETRWETSIKQWKTKRCCGNEDQKMAKYWIEGRFTDPKLDNSGSKTRPLIGFPNETKYDPTDSRCRFLLFARPIRPGQRLAKMARAHRQWSRSQRGKAPDQVERARKRDLESQGARPWPCFADHHRGQDLSRNR